ARQRSKRAGWEKNLHTFGPARNTALDFLGRGWNTWRRFPAPINDPGADRKLPVCPHNEQDEMTRTSRFAGSMLSIGFCLVGTSLLGGCQQSSLPGKQDAAAVTSDLVLINGKFLTVDANDSVAQAVAISNGKIVTVGNNADVQSRAAKNARV